ncbi:MAG: M28 family peptidase [Candidatus Lindowbacteria bacterium]|nr:M28 family peptidase [Candidatus Lindowbacteria bacterium]
MLSIQPIEHVKALCSDVGPRGPTTEAEARAAAYAAARLGDFGARDVSVEPFRSVPSLWWAFEVASGIALASTAIYLYSRGSAWGWSALLCALAICAIVAELSFWKVSLSNLLPKRVSQNVYGKISPKGKTARRLVVIGHLDTNRTPLLFHPSLVPYLNLILMAVAGCVALKGLIFLFAGVQDGAGVRGAVLILDIPAAVALLVMLHGDLFSPFTQGANDNATGAAVTLSVAELFSRDPLERTEYWALCTGCEEATLTGIRAFLDKHGEELKDAYFVDLECLGIGKLRYITYEGMLKKCYSNSGLLRAASEAAKALGDGSVEASPLKLGYTETAVVISHGLRGITVMAFPEGSELVPHWHQTSDRLENIDPRNLDKAVRFLVALAREIDS